MTAPLTILIIDDSLTELMAIQSCLDRAFQRGTYNLHTAESVCEAREIFMTEPSIDLAFVDHFLPDGEITDEFLKSVKEVHPETVLFATSSDEHHFCLQMFVCHCGVQKGHDFTFENFKAALRNGSVKHFLSHNN